MHNFVSFIDYLQSIPSIFGALVERLILVR